MGRQYFFPVAISDLIKTKGTRLEEGIFWSKRSVDEEVRVRAWQKHTIPGTLNCKGCLIPPPLPPPPILQELGDVYTINLSRRLNCLSTLKSPLPDAYNNSSSYNIRTTRAGVLSGHTSIFQPFSTRKKNCQRLSCVIWFLRGFFFFFLILPFSIAVLLNYKNGSRIRDDGGSAYVV